MYETSSIIPLTSLIKYSDVLKSVSDNHPVYVTNNSIRRKVIFNGIFKNKNRSYKSR